MKLPKTLKEGDAVFVEWRDASSNGKWGDFEGWDVPVVQTVSFYRGCDKKNNSIRLAADFDSSAGSFGSRTVIPIEQVVSIKKIKV